MKNINTDVKIPKKFKYRKYRKSRTQGMEADAISRKLIQVINHTVNMTALTIIILFIAYAGYALWDSHQIYQAADKSHYEKYKPTAENEGISFKELQSINAEVIAWLSVYGTNINYPVTQGQNNMKYVDTNAEGQYSLSGSIFLDCSNSMDFNDFNNILYGHHMANKVMFGEIGEFSEEKMFDSHKYGILYFDEKDHGIEFFAYIHTSAYNNAVFTANVKEDERQTYLDGLLTNAIYKRDIGVTTEDHIILLSTCSSSSTNGRDILIGRITSEIYEDPFLNTKKNDGENQGADSQSGLVKEIYLMDFILAVLSIALISVIYYSRKIKRRN